MGKGTVKGTRGENEVVDLFVGAGFPRADPEDPESIGVKRHRGGFESHDITGVGNWVIESKFRVAWHVFGWVRKVRKVAGDRPWAIVATHGRRNTKEGREVGQVMILDSVLGAKLIERWEATGGEPF